MPIVCWGCRFPDEVNRLVQLWASTGLTGILSERDGQTLCADVLRRQEPDGGWTIRASSA